MDTAEHIDGYDIPDQAEAIEIDFLEVASGYGRQSFGTRAFQASAGGISRANIVRPRDGEDF